MNAEVAFNEIMASNTRAYPDITDFEDYPDWIELKNFGAVSASLDGYFLSDDPVDPYKWAIPVGTSIPANGFLTLIADGHDAAPGDTYPRGYWPWKTFVTEKYHANFSLSAAGESLTLVQATGEHSVSLVNASVPVPVAPMTAAEWRYRDDGSDLGVDWRSSSFDDTTWAAGMAKLGYGDPVKTTVSYGPRSSGKYVTTYFRHRFTVNNPAAFHRLTMRLLVDDGCVVYLNGVEVARRNMPFGEVDYRMFAASTVNDSDEGTYYSYAIPVTRLAVGVNVLAVEVHQADATSSDISFDLGLVGTSYTGTRVVDQMSYGPQVSDISYGRDPVDKTRWRFFAESTPGAENRAAVVEDVRVSGHAVKFSVPGGFYVTSQAVELSAPGGVIHYTLDGGDPRSTSSVYTGPIRIGETTVLRARVFEVGKAPGPITTATFFLGEATPQVAYVSVVADPVTLFDPKIGIYRNQHESVTGSYGLRDVYKGKDAPGHVELFAPGGVSGFSAGCGIRIGGENNWVHPQKALNISIQAKYGDDSINYDLFPGSRITVHTSFVLRDSGDNWASDMLRDCLNAKLAVGHLKADVADYSPSIVFINGAYYGIHDIRQRWDEAWFAGRYHLAADRIDHLLYGHVTSDQVTLGVEKGTSADWLELMTFIDTADLTVAANWEYVESKIDMDSLMDFVIAESYGNNNSWSWNREFWKEKSPGGRWRWFLPDMDRTFSTSALTGVLSDLLDNEDVLRRLKANRGFVQRLAQRYAAHMASTYKPSRVIDVLSAMDTEVASLVPRHVIRWAPDGTTKATRNSRIQQMKDYANRRAANFDAEVSTQLGVGKAIELTLAVDGVGQGSVLVQGVRVEPSTFKMYSNIPIELRAIPAPGYGFSHWSGVLGTENTTVTLSRASTITAHFIRSKETVIGGEITGRRVLDRLGSPYALSSDLIVAKGATLEIQAGVTIEMPTQSNLRVQGVLNVLGSAEQPVTMRGRSGDRWGGISFENTVQPSLLSHLIVRGATAGHDPLIYSSGISGYNSDVVMEWLDVRESDSPVFMYGGNCVLRDSTLHHPYVGDSAHFKRGRAMVQRCIFPGNNAPDTDAIDFDGVVDGVIEDCRIYHFQGTNSDGIDIGEGTQNLLLQGNLIYYSADKGVSVGQGSTIVMRRNVVVGCVLGVGIKDAGSSAVLDQNTFVACGSGVAVYEKNFGAGGGSAVVSNSIFSKSTSEPIVFDGFSQLSGDYNLSDTTRVAGVHSLIADPLFADPILLNFELRRPSPAIDAGDPAHAQDLDHSRADIGAGYTYNPRDYPYTIGETVVVNELLANSGTGSDWIELHNRTRATIDIGGWFLSDSGTNLLKYRIPLGTQIPGDGYLVLYENATFGVGSVDTNKITAFALSDGGETVYLSAAVNDQLTDYRTKEDFGPSATGETLGAYYKASSDSYNFVAMQSPTPGAANSDPRVGPVVISEIHYHPGGVGTGDAEYVELLNISTNTVSLYDAVKGKPWRLTGGVHFEFPSVPPLSMAPGERLVVAKSMAMFSGVYGSQVPKGVRVFEWGNVSLSNGGETLELERPGAVDAVNGLQYIRVDRVNYDDVEPWPTEADGHGSSLCRILERGYGNDFSNWTAATPTPGSPTLQSTGDSDGDGLFDIYELANGMNPRDPMDAALDIDGDGMSNLDESRAGTNPRDSSEVLHLALRPESEAVVLRFVAVTGKSYTIQYKSVLTDPAWLDLGRVDATEVTAIKEIRDTNAGLRSQRFYRLITP